VKIEIKTVFGDLIFEGDFTCMAEAIKAALAAKKSLSSANLSSADLSSADLRYADLSSANLSYANLSYADLSSADLSSADLRYADLSSADLSYANLSSANLRETKGSALAIAQTRILPEGNIIGWKMLCGGIIAKILIPVEAKRSHAFGRKCRGEFARVLELIKDGKPFDGEGTSIHSPSFKYRVGEIVRPDEFSKNWMDECAPGIHFFITREEAEAYN